MHFHQNNLSLWQEDVILSDMPMLNRSLTTDVCIVGAGISGLLTAYQLLKNEFKVVILEKDDLGYGETALSSAHLSDVFDDHFKEILKKNGLDRARLAYQSHMEAIDTIERIIHDEKIDCDFRRLEGYLFLAPEHDRVYLQDEMKAAQDCGVVDVQLLTQPLKAFFDTGTCLRFAHQAQFHPLKFINGLCERIRAMGGQIYTRTRVEFVQDGKNPFAETVHGYRVSADHVVVATNVPINNLMSVHLKEAAFRTYVVGMKIPRGSVPSALYWDTGTPYHYIRIDSAPERDFDVLIVGGEDHRVGQEEHPELIFQKLRDWAQKRLGISDLEVVYNWSGQIVEPMDGLAYIGRNPGEKNVYIVTGDSGQGITHGAIASLLLTSLIKGENHRWESVYDPSRFNWRSLGHFMKDNAQSGIQYVDWIYRDEKDVADLLPGQGCVVSDGLTKTAVFRDSDGDLHRLSATCPHMGGVVKWNGAEQTWDCPCHGSRFSKMGEVLNGPAIHDLTPVQKEEKTPGISPRKKDSDFDTFYRGSR
ncbi:FAD-dependent oxidoreductase [Bdellovibrio svalbardensis]|uniref:FAD-dependent oxidoreductase n=1 Tax=Bdellovibrio svalbardensis TaxID=2972972 RepID=A0ABT6DK89_9BACT|nr:FAD-dependent oxidoreductase [Bdellovibrio svalbardensis]MDG0816954.1 FAD-dependent oxidoreductase [Bdellovibrio svalbardensis]